MAFVVDAAGILGATSSRNLFPKLGSLHGVDLANMTSKEVYDAVPATTAAITLATTCDGVTTQYFLGSDASNFVQIGLVRHGHVVTQLTLSSLEFHDAEGGLYGPCAGFEPVLDPNPELQLNENANCNGFGNNACRTEYPDCVGFVQGSSWGRCYSVCEAPGVPAMWAEVTAWADTVSLRLAWDSAIALPSGCTGDITATFSGGVSASRTMALSNEAETGELCNEPVWSRSGQDVHCC
jgi:hypothetical protein